MSNILNDEELRQLDAIAERLKRERPEKRGERLFMTHATEDALTGLIALGRNNRSAVRDLQSAMDGIDSAWTAANRGQP